MGRVARPRSRRASHSGRDPIANHLGARQAAIMEALWRREAATVQEVVDVLNTSRARRREPDLAYTTIMTLLSRLHARGLVTRERDGRAYRYAPARTRDELLRQLADDVIAELLEEFGEIGVNQFEAQLRTRRGGR
jgi:predicted transcriptional regulator